MKLTCKKVKLNFNYKLLDNNWANWATAAVKMVDELPKWFCKSVANCWRIGLAWAKTWAPENNNWVNSAVNWANKPAPTFWISDQMLPKPSWFKKKSAKSLLPESI